MLVALTVFNVDFQNPAFHIEAGSHKHFGTIEDPENLIGEDIDNNRSTDDWYIQYTDHDGSVLSIYPDQQSDIIPFGAGTRICFIHNATATKITYIGRRRGVIPCQVHWIRRTASSRGARD